ncbi:unnamed protein product [Allacma fusca]|uniref:Uncharacterized protein n=1 Tax=Allacma fusca TaxID=39272 RepID=A0A8J2KLJ8_9HEXA|nr:unnamed protein product [Allacma fusca]
MKIPIYIAVVLFCVTIVQGHCRFKVPVTSRFLRCGGLIVQRDQSAVNATNFCGEGKNGAEITNKDVTCIFDKLGYSINGHILVGKLLDEFSKIFGAYGVSLFQKTMECFPNSDNDDDKDPLSRITCLTKAYVLACGYITCDWINTVD